MTTNHDFRIDLRYYRDKSFITNKNLNVLDINFETKTSLKNT